MTTTFLAQLTDLHIREPGRLTYRRIDTAQYLERAVQSVLALPQQPHALVITGDLTDFGRPAEYAHLRSLLAPLGELPIYLLPGNHDDRDGLRAAFPEHAWLRSEGFIQYAVDIGDLRLIALDTVVPGHSEGALCEERLQWLELQLTASEGRPVVIAMHHPPFETLIGHMDKIGLLQGARALEDLVRRHPNVQRVICGPGARCGVGLDAGAARLHAARPAAGRPAGQPRGGQRAIRRAAPVLGCAGAADRLSPDPRGPGKTRRECPPWT
jgi:3',5'-cyclic AMP phosphodiesterase CpdA